MSNALVKRSAGESPARGVLAGVASAVFPGLGQLLVNGEKDKALGMAVVYGVSGLGIVGAIPVVGWAAGLVCGATWLYSVADGYIVGKKKRRR